jgi:hypothetical protein
MENKTNTKNIVVSLVIGEKFGNQYARYFKKSHEKYAKNIGTDFIVIKDLIEKSDKHPSWQKLLICRIPEIASFSKILFIDADVYINNFAKNIFNFVPEGSFAAVKNNSQNISRIEDGDRNVISIQSPEKDRPPYLINGGVLVIETENKSILENVYNTYNEQICYEQGPLSYHLINSKNFTLLESKFNTIIPDYLEVNKYRLSSIIKMYKENYFIHSAGGINKVIINMLILFDKYPKLLISLENLSKIKLLDFLIGTGIKMIYSTWWRFDKIVKE